MTIERVLSGVDRWAIVEGENLTLMRSLPPGSVHLVYGDAPFFTNRDFHAEDGRLAYSDRWPSMAAFVRHVRARCAAARDLLTEDGTLVAQVDPETSHYVKVALDSVFGRACFRNEIIWRHRRWPTKTQDFQRMHDVLLRYTRHPKKERWNQLYEPLSPATLAIHGTKKQKHAVTEKGRKWGSHPGESPEDSPGAYLSDVWEIGVIAPLSAERIYPTQKPRALADRVVLSCSHVGDMVLDPWCGGGTHVSAAVAHGRRGGGIDQSPLAVEVATKRLRAETAQSDWLRGT